ncbi:MAG: signal peptidase I [Solirubrobacterales bacterium]|nr:signal peptidase I [Solirubrobacterales bacterium]
MKLRRDSTVGSIVELILVIAGAVGIALIVQQFLIKPYRIPSESMVPTLTVGQRVLVDRLGERFSAPDVGDIVVFHPPTGADTSECGTPGQGPFYYDGPHSRLPCNKPTPNQSEQTFIKRLVAGPGDTISVRDGHAVVNGVVAPDAYTRPCGDKPECNLGTITIPAGHYFMMGDNRGESDDSRFWGPVPKDWLIGAAVATYWPPNRIGIF